jgi:PTS system galactitol-specific IIC component
MYILPKMVGILMEGLVPLSEGIGEFMTKKFEGRELFMGMDAAIFVGDPANIATAVVLIPITLLLSVILPGNGTLPLADLPATVYFCVIIVAITRGNLFRSIIIGTFVMSVLLYTSTAMAPYITESAKLIGYKMPGGTTLVTSMGAAINWIPYIVEEIITKIGMLF